MNFRTLLLNQQWQVLNIKL
jgi:hypothetical protein